MTLCIISHTEHYTNTKGELVAWGSTVSEINHLIEIADQVIHVAPLYDENPPSSSLPYEDRSKVHFIPLKPSGGKGLKKFNIAWTAFFNLKQIQKGINKADFIQFRAPTGMGVYVLPYLKWFCSKPYWVKYAGNWIDPAMPLGNRLQKQWLQNHIKPETKVTYNGSWEQKPQFLSFHNPCFTIEDYIKAKSFLESKSNPKEEGWTLCFVGALNEHKGVTIILEALKHFQNSDKIKTVHLVGDGPKRKQYEEFAENLQVKVIFHGFLPKSEVNDILGKSHALLLPSKSEGFPKVVGEAMAFGCIPVVSNVSCIQDYITDGQNGFILDSLTYQSLVISMNQMLSLSLFQIIKLRLKNYNFAKCFTYQYYNAALQDNILDVRQ